MENKTKLLQDLTDDSRNEYLNISWILKTINRENHSDAWFGDVFDQIIELQMLRLSQSQIDQLKLSIWVESFKLKVQESNQIFNRNVSFWVFPQLMVNKSLFLQGFIIKTVADFGEPVLLSLFKCYYQCFYRKLFLFYGLVGIFLLKLGNKSGFHCQFIDPKSVLFQLSFQ